MIEVDCETDFVARNEVFTELVHDLALQVAASAPKYVTPEEIPAEQREENRRIFSDAAVAEGKKPELVERIVQGKMENWYKEVCLVRQPFIRDDKMTVNDLIQSAIAKLKENIVVRRFARFAIGE